MQHAAPMAVSNEAGSGKSVGGSYVVELLQGGAPTLTAPAGSLLSTPPEGSPFLPSESGLLSFSAQHHQRYN